VFLNPQHPKHCVAPTPDAIARLLRSGWVGQCKVNGHRAQSHVGVEGGVRTSHYFTRQGTRHTAKVPQPITAALECMFEPVESTWTVVDAEWQKEQGVFYLFDLLKLHGKSLDHLSFGQRHAFLSEIAERLNPIGYDSVSLLPILTTVDACMSMLQNESPAIEGLVFRSLNSKGFEDTAIVRCRKSGAVFTPQKTSLLKAER